MMSASPIPISPGNVCIFGAADRAADGSVVAAWLTKGRFTVRIIKLIFGIGW